MNWLLSREAQSIFARSFGTPSTRLDASTEGIDPILMPKPDQKYYTETEEFVDAQARWMDLSKKVIEGALR